MIKLLLVPALSLIAVFAAPAAGQSGADIAETLNLEQKTALRCSAAFAIVAGAQGAGVEQALAYPALDQRGQEFFVRSAARVMDETGLSNVQVAEYVQDQAQTLFASGEYYEIMPSCMVLLEASGL